eukprot:756153-Hanusia_phi.AAC.5
MEMLRPCVVFRGLLLSTISLIHNTVKQKAWNPSGTPDLEFLAAASPQQTSVVPFHSLSRSPALSSDGFPTVVVNGRNPRKPQTLRASNGLLLLVLTFFSVLSKLDSSDAMTVRCCTRATVTTIVQASGNSNQANRGRILNCRSAPGGEQGHDVRGVQRILPVDNMLR